MFNRVKNLKIIQKLKTEISPKMRWLKFSHKSDKTSEDYLKMVTGVELQTIADEQKLEAKVRKQLKAEFPNIENMKSYELLVDAVVHNIKKKQLQAMDDLDVE